MIQSSGMLSEASIQVLAAADKTSFLTLSSRNSTNYTLSNDGAKQQLILTSDDTQVLVVNATGGSTVIQSDLTIGGDLATPGPRALTVQSQPGLAWMPATALREGGSLHALQNAPPSLLQSSVNYKLCYATGESEGDKQSDFVQLNGTFLRAVGFVSTHSTQIANMRVASNSSVVTLAQLPPLSAVFLEQSNTAPVCVNRTNSGSVPLEMYSNGTATNRHTTLASGGTYRLCISFAQSSSFQQLHGLQLFVLDAQHIRFEPSSGRAGVITKIRFSGGVQAGDFIVMQVGGCGGAASVTTSNVTMGRSIVDSTRGVSTSALMNGAVVMSVCFATKESGGVGDDDFVQLAHAFVQTTITWSFG